jgi:hypothetical protein
MENSEIQKRIINLGKTLVKELGLDRDIDKLARWMVHYIAEQMIITENATGEDKIEANERCFETILKFWQHRSYLPNGHRPFENFEPIFRTLERLDSEKSNQHFYSILNLRSSESDHITKESDKVQNWLDIAKKIDQVARICLEYVFHQAALDATDEKVITYLQNAVDLPVDDDISIIIRLRYEDSENDNEETVKQEQKIKQEKLESRIKKLDKFIDFSKELREKFISELEAITRDISCEGRRERE